MVGSSKGVSEFLRRVPMSAYFAQIRPASPTSDARGATERCVCACACVRACVERRCPAQSGRVRHSTQAKHAHSAPEILRGKNSRQVWEIESILLARTRRSPPLHAENKKRAAETEPKQEPGTHAPRPTPWRMAQAPAHSPCVPARPFREAFVRFQSSKRKSFQHAGAQEHRSTGASSRLGCQ